MSLYRVVRFIGGSPTSWEQAAKEALEEAAKHLEDLRVAEVEQLDVRMKENKVVEYRARVRASFRYHPEKHDLTRASGARRPLDRTCACRELDPYVLVMQSTQDRTGEHATNGLDGARNRRVLVQGQVGSIAMAEPLP